MALVNSGGVRRSEDIATHREIAKVIVRERLLQRGIVARVKVRHATRI